MKELSRNHALERARRYAVPEDILVIIGMGNLGFAHEAIEIFLPLGDYKQLSSIGEYYQSVYDGKSDQRVRKSILDKMLELSKKGLG